MSYLARVMFDQSRRDIVSETDVKVLGVQTFEDVDIFHEAPLCSGARLRPVGYGVAAFARFAPRDLAWLAKP